MTIIPAFFVTKIGENLLTKNGDNFDGFLNFPKNIHQNWWQNMRQENLTKIGEKFVTKIGDKIFGLDFPPELVTKIGD